MNSDYDIHCYFCNEKLKCVSYDFKILFTCKNLCENFSLYEDGGFYLTIRFKENLSINVTNSIIDKDSPVSLMNDYEYIELPNLDLNVVMLPYEELHSLARRYAMLI